MLRDRHCLSQALSPYLPCTLREKAATAWPPLPLISGTAVGTQPLARSLVAPLMTLSVLSRRLSPSRLTGVDWQLCVGTAGSGGERGQSAHSIIELQLTTQQPAGSSGGASSGGASGGAGSGGAGSVEERKVHLRVGREGLTELLGKLDQIQTQIDKLS